MVFTKWRHCAPHLIHASLGPSESTTQMTCWSVPPFLHSSWQNVIGHVLSHKNCLFTRGDLDLHAGLIWFLNLGPTRALNLNGISIGSAVFAQLSAECPYTSQWDASFPLKIAAFHGGGSGPYLMHGSLGPPESSTQKASSSVQPFFAGLTAVTDRQTHATSFVTIGHIYVRSITNNYSCCQMLEIVW